MVPNVRERSFGVSMSELSIPHAIEKVTFRLGLRSAGYITLAEIFVQFPLSFEIIDEHVSRIADGRTILKDESGEYAAVHFPEFSSIGEQISTSNNCPVCLGNAPSPCTVAGEEVPAPLICDSCYRTIGRMALPEKSSAFSRKIKSFFTEPEEDSVKTTIMEHEICYKALLIGGKELTHTAIAAQTRYGMVATKDHLQSMGARRYVKLGLTTGGDAVAYSLPETLRYPEPYFQRFRDTMDFITKPIGRLPKSNTSSPKPRLEIGVKNRGSQESGGVSFQRHIRPPSGRNHNVGSNRVARDSGAIKIVLKKKGNEQQSPTTGSNRSSAIRISIKSTGRNSQPDIRPPIQAPPLPPPAPPLPEIVKEPLRPVPAPFPAPPAEQTTPIIQNVDTMSAEEGLRLTDSVEAAIMATEAVELSGVETAAEEIKDTSPEVVLPDEIDPDGIDPDDEIEEYDGGLQAGEFIGTPVD
jgi:hypothetical protein